MNIAVTIVRFSKASATCDVSIRRRDRSYQDNRKLKAPDPKVDLSPDAFTWVDMKFSLDLLS